MNWKGYHVRMSVATLERGCNVKRASGTLEERSSDQKVDLIEHISSSSMRHFEEVNTQTSKLACRLLTTLMTKIAVDSARCRNLPCGVFAGSVGCHVITRAQVRSTRDRARCRCSARSAFFLASSFAAILGNLYSLCLQLSSG